MGLIDKVAPYVTLVEGPNEVNAIPVSYKGLGGAAAAQAYQADFYNAVHSDPNLAGVRVMPFSLSMGFDMSGYGNVSAYADVGNVHAYSGQGLPPFDQINYWTNQVTTAPGKPYAITETGFTTIYEPRGGVTEDVQAKWLMDTFLGNHINGVVKTYVYQLEDGYSSPSSDIENHYGLFTVDGAPKQAATDLHNLTTILADKGANANSFTPGSLDYSVSGLDPTYGFQTLFSKSNGSFDVALWSEPNFFNPSTSQEANVTPSTVTVKLNGTYNVDVFDPVVGTGAIRHAQGVSSIDVQLTTDPLIVEVTPAGGTAASAPVATPVAAATTADTTAAPAAAPVAHRPPHRRDDRRRDPGGHDDLGGVHRPDRGGHRPDGGGSARDPGCVQQRGRDVEPGDTRPCRPVVHQRVGRGDRRCRYRLEPGVDRWSRAQRVRAARRHRERRRHHQLQGGSGRRRRPRAGRLRPRCGADAGGRDDVGCQRRLRRRGGRDPLQQPREPRSGQRRLRVTVGGRRQTHIVSAGEFG